MGGGSNPNGGPAGGADDRPGVLHGGVLKPDLGSGCGRRRTDPECEILRKSESVRESRAESR